MKIGIDVSQVIYGKGVSFYTRNLVENLLSVDKENEYVLFGGSLRRKKDLESFASSLAGKFTTRFVLFPPTLANIVWNRLHLFTIERFIGKVDVYHSSDWAQAPSEAFRVTTIHDIAPFKFPELNPGGIRNILSAHKARLKWVEAEVDRVIVPSEATKKDLVELGMDEGKIRVIYEAPGKVFKPQSEQKIDSVKRQYKIPGRYVISVGVGGRKNTERLIKAFDLSRAGKNLSLVLVGPRDIQVDRRGIRYVGNVDDSKLAVLLSGAEALVYPSLYEGFGLPILQAFACGTPVVTSNISSMPEVAGGAAVLVDPYSVNSIVEGIKKAVSAPRALIKKGFARVKDFSWEKAALETLKVYNETS